MSPVVYPLAPEKSESVFNFNTLKIEIRNHHNSELETYKRRKLPHYLLNYDRSDYPTFFSNDDIPMPFLVKNNEETADDESQIKSHIQIRVNLDNHKEKLTASKKGGRVNKQMQIDLKGQMILSPNEIVKLILKEVYNKYAKILKKENLRNIWALKANEFDEYFYGRSSP